MPPGVYNGNTTRVCLPVCEKRSITPGYASLVGITVNNTRVCLPGGYIHY